MFKLLIMEDKGDIHSEQEREHFHKIIHSFKAYRVFNRAVIFKRLRYLSTLSERQQQLLLKYKRRLEKAAECIDHNDTIIKLIIRDVEQMFENVNHKPVAGQKRSVTNQDIEKVNITIKQIYRDWTVEGAIERDKCYRPIIEEIEKYFPEHECNRADIKVLIPGAGLGRLAFEVAKRGFTCQGNEFSFYMLMASNFILNNCLGAGGNELYPWVHQLDNILSSEDQFKKVSFPDCDPSDLYSLHGTSRFSMTAGDFTEMLLKQSRIFPRVIRHPERIQRDEHRWFSLMEEKLIGIINVQISAGVKQIINYGFRLSTTMYNSIYYSTFIDEF
ncbi:unnamed protein product [Nezara viridula]|uniref:carnosine N-methyltransferase n=1 Tax=Nezara viridula TaxID=85310 RepID=A0A9P0HKS1_NEZVI|nr:unnamed protein product [Nezara viridula]